MTEQNKYDLVFGLLFTVLVLLLIIVLADI